MAKKRANGEGNIRKRKDGRREGRCTAGYNPGTGKRIISWYEFYANPNVRSATADRCLLIQGSVANARTKKDGMEIEI